MRNALRFLVTFLGCYGLCALLLLAYATLTSPASAQTIRIRDLPTLASPTASDYVALGAAAGGTYKASLSSLASAIGTVGVPTSRVIACTPPLLCDGSTSMDLSGTRTLSLSPFYLPLTGGTMTANAQIAQSGTPAIGGSVYQFLATGGTVTGATNEGVRNAMFSLFDSRTSANDGAIITLDMIQRTHSSTITRTGIHCKSYTEPDNGGDTSCGLFVSTGGSTGITVGKLHNLRPSGFTDYGTSSQPALEVHTGDQGPAIYAIAGSGIGGTPYRSQAMIASLGASSGSTQSGGIVVQPLDGTFDARDGYTIGTASLGASPVNVKFQALLSGQFNTTNKAQIGGTITTPDARLTVNDNTASTLTAPTAGTAIHVVGADSTASRVLIDTFGSAPVFQGRAALGTNASPSAVTTQTILLNMAGFGYGATGYSSGGRGNIQIKASENWSDSAQGAMIDFLTTPAGTASAGTTLRLEDSGHLVSLGTAPTVACTGTGTSPSAPTIVGTDSAFVVTINTGTGTPGSTGTCTVTFAKAYTTNAPIMSCMLVKGATAWGNNANLQLTTESTTAPVITWTNLVGGTATALTVSTSYKFSCINMGRL